jgi:hypothetical protein
MSTQDIPDKIIKAVIGFPTGKKLWRVKGKDMVAYAKSINETRPEYISPGTNAEGKPDYAKIIGHTALPAMWAISAAMGMDDAGYKDSDTGKVYKLDINFAKLLHTAQEYDYEGCVPIKDGDKLTTTGKLADVYIKGSPGKELLWITIEMVTKNQKDEPVVKIRLSAGIRKGGYGVKVEG